MENNGSIPGNWTKPFIPSPYNDTYPDYDPDFNLTTPIPWDKFKYPRDRTRYPWERPWIPDPRPEYPGGGTFVTIDSEDPPLMQYFFRGFMSGLSTAILLLMIIAIVVYMLCARYCNKAEAPEGEDASALDPEVYQHYFGIAKVKEKAVGAKKEAEGAKEEVVGAKEEAVEAKDTEDNHSQEHHYEELIV